MATTRPKIKSGGTRKRTTARVEETESSGNKVARSAEHRKAKPVEGTVTPIGEDQLLVQAQVSELVPVAQYANVTIGPVQLGWVVSGVDMEALIDVDWGDDPEDRKLTKEQQAVYNRARGAIDATMAIIEDAISEDRESVERSVRQHNEREAADKKKK